MDIPHTHARWLRLVFFWSGIMATVAYRIIIILTEFSAWWVKFAWYFGTVGFVVYFVHRYQVGARRARLIAKRGLADKVAGLQELSVDDRAAMAYVFASLESSKEQWNYIAIFVTSAIALAAGLYLDLR